MNIAKLPEYTTLAAKVEALLAVDGTTVAPAYTRIRDGIETLYAYVDNRAEAARAALTTAIRNGDSDAIPALTDSLTIAAQDGMLYQANRTVGELLPELTDAYRATAAANYDVLRDRFNTAAAELAHNANLVDLSISNPYDLLPLPKKQQDAWQGTHAIVGRLQELAGHLLTAADAAGINLNDESLEPSTWDSDRTLPLVVDPTGIHVRRLWEAWDDTTGTFGRWGSLALAGYPINARALNDIAPQRRPRPLENRQRRAKADGLIAYEQFTVDPEDIDYQPTSQGLNAA